ncbi:MAG: hypothetical protein ABI406_20310 [Ktedonobacteraceae bacterium]
MVKNRMLHVITTSVLLAVVAVCLTAVVASAHPVTVHRSVGVSVSSAPASGAPNSNIVQKSGKKAHYNPSSLACSISTQLSFDITNQTSVSQSVVYNGLVLATIPAGKHQGFFIPVKGTYQLHLKGSTSVLTVTAS